MHGWHQGGAGQERYAMSPASSLALYGRLCLVEQCPARKCVAMNRGTWNWRQRAGSNLQLRVCKSNSHHSRPPNPCFSKRFWKGDWGGPVTAHILDLYGYGYDYTVRWEVGTFLSSFAGGCMLGIKEKMTNIPAITTCFTKTPGVREKSFRPNQSESNFLNASDLANIPREERHTYIQSTLFLWCKANYWMTWVIPHLPLKAPDQHL